MKINTLTRLHTKALGALQLISQLDERLNEITALLVKYDLKKTDTFELFPLARKIAYEKRIDIDYKIMARLIVYYRDLVSKIEEIKND